MPSKIKKRGKNSYLLTVVNGYDAKGHQNTHTKTVKCPNEKQAEKEYALFVAEIEKGQVASSGKMTLDDFISIWLEKHAERQLAPKTALRYKQLLTSWIIPALGHIRLDKIKPPQILDFYNNLTENGIRKDGKPGGLSPRTILHIHRLLHTILQAASQWEYLNINPASKVQAPKAKQANIQIMDEEQIKVFILELDNAELKWKLMSLLILTAGLRIGEALGIEWRHINWEKGTLSIEQSSQYIDGVGIITKSPKNTSSERLISLPESVIGLLKQYRAIQRMRRANLENKWEGSKDSDNDRIFISWNGKPMFPNSFNVWLKKFCQEKNLPHITPHSLRHLSATILINGNIPLKNLSARLGHSKTSTTIDIYAHFLKSTDKLAAEKMEDILKTISNNPQNTEEKQDD